MLRIWSVMFGHPVLRNDLTIMDKSGPFDDIQTGKWPHISICLCIGISIETDLLVD